VAKKQQPLSQPSIEYPDFKVVASYYSNYGISAKNAFVVDPDEEGYTPWDGKNAGRVAIVPANYALDGQTVINYREDRNYAPDATTGYLNVAGNPNSPSPSRPTYQQLAPTIYYGDHVVQVGSLVSQDNVLVASPVFAAAGPATNFNMKAN
jgi:hypothetical protein